MSIASEITRINNNIAAAYTAASGKGATLPATENSANLATCIGSISGGSSKFGANLDTFIGEIDANGKLQLPTEQSDLVFTGVQSIVNLIYKFTRTGIKSVSFPDLVSLASGSSISGAFYDCPNNTSANFGALQEVSKSYALQNTFGFNPVLTTVNFPELVTLTGEKAFENCFIYDTDLTTINFPKLTTASFGTYTNQFQGMFGYNSGETNGCTVHFPSNLQSKISSMTGYPTFGGTSGYITIAFDLAATS